MKNLLVWALLLATPGYADTPPPRNVTADMYDGSGNPLTSVNMSGNYSLGVDVLNPISQPANTAIIYGGSVVDPRARTWTLNESADTVKAQMQDNSGNGITSTLVNGSHQAIDANVVGITTTTTGDLSSTGNITTTCASPSSACQSGSSVTLSISGVASAQVQISGTFSGAVLGVYGTIDGVSWVQLYTATGAAAPYTTASFGAIGKYRVFRIAGLTQIRVSATVLESGTVTAEINASSGTDLVEAVQQTASNFLTESWMSDGYGNPLSSLEGALSTNITNLSLPVTGTFWQATQPVSAASLPLPSNASTATNQATVITDLGTLATNQTSGNQETQVTNFPATQTVAGTVTANAGTGTFQTNVTNSSIPVSQFGSFTTGRNWSLSSGSDSVNVGNFPSSYPVTGTFWQATQPVSAASLPLPSNAAQESGGHLASIDTKLTAPLATNATLQAGSAAVGTVGVTTTVPTSDVLVSGVMSSSGASVSENVSGIAEGVLSIVGTFSGSINIQCVYPGNVTANLPTLQSGLSPPWSSAAVTTTGNFKFIGASGCPTLQAVYASYTSGSPTVTIDAGSSLGNPRINQTNSAALAAGAWFNNSGTQIQGSADGSGDQNVNVVNTLPGRGVLSTFTQSYVSSNLSTSAFTTIISSTSAAVNEEDIFDTSGGVYYLAYAATCGALASSTNAVIIGAGGGGKDFQIPSGNCVGFEALGSALTTGNVYMTFYK